MSHIDAPIDSAADPHLDVKKDFSLVAKRPGATIINRKFLVISGVSLGAILSLFFITRIMSAAQPHTGKKDAAAATSSPPSSAAPVAPVGYQEAFNVTSSGDSAAAPDCATNPGFANCVNIGGAAAAPRAQTPASSAAQTPAQVSAVSPVVQASQAQAQAARSAGVFFGGDRAASTAGAGLAGSAAGQGGNPLTALAGALNAHGQTGVPGALPAQPASDVLTGNGQSEKQAFASTTSSQDYVTGTLQRPRSPYEIKAGSIIVAALLTAIDSDLPGEIIAQVTQPVYDHVSGRFLLIPQGSRLIGHYDSQVAYGQNRAMIAWTRIILPNGDSINIGSMEGADLTGASGLHDRVNNHYGQLAGGIALSTMIAVGSAAATDSQSRATGETVINAGASGASTEAAQVGDRIVDRDLSRQPTIEVRAGMALRVLVSKDIVLEPYR
ncbi:MAG: TraB/TrbI/VirB10 family type IV secretion system protein [Caulobacteraceae bacterium]